MPHSTDLVKKIISKMVEKAVAKGTAIVWDEMQTMETRLTSQTKNFATYAAKALKKDMATLQQALTKKMTALESTDMLEKEVLMVIN